MTAMKKKWGHIQGRIGAALAPRGILTENRPTEDQLYFCRLTQRPDFGPALCISTRLRPFMSEMCSVIITNFVNLIVIITDNFNMIINKS